MSLQGKRILLGVSASIAAYKAADICSQLGKLDADVHVVLTPKAARFVGAATFQALTRNPVLTDVFDEPQARRIAHIDLAQSADIVLVAPASADILARMAHGLADDLLATCLLATPAATPVLVAPAMNTVMWEHPATVANLSVLQKRGVQVIAPAAGLLACQDVGTGKLADVADIVQAIIDRLHPDQTLSGRRVLITAGATREPIDPVRFLSNRSSGKMGYALAEEALRRGAQVTLVTGFATVSPPSGAEVVRVETALEMRDACLKSFESCHLFIAAAAVADYAPETLAVQKIKKPESSAEAGQTLTLTLHRTPDILATLAATRHPGQTIVGFAAETENLVENARRKLQSKRLDMVVANDVTQEGAGFDVDTNIVTLVTPDGVQSLPRLSKRDVARRIFDAIQSL